MSSASHEPLSFDDFDEEINPRPEETDFDRIVEAAINRRGFLRVNDRSGTGRIRQLHLGLFQDPDASEEFVHQRLQLLASVLQTIDPLRGRHCVLSCRSLHR